VNGGDYAKHQLLLGTHTSGSEPNHLCVATVLLPTEDTELDVNKYDEERAELGGYGGSLAKVEISVRITHDREVNRARYCPQNYFLVGTKSPSADVLVFDWSKHPSKPADAVVRPLVRCKGHEKEGYGISWSTHTAGRLASAGDDHLVCVFDVETGPVPQQASASAAAAASVGDAASTAAAAAGSAAATTSERAPTFRITGHTRVVEDVAWHRFTPDLLGSCGDDALIALWDLRDPGTALSKPKLTFTNGHAADVMSLSFSPYQDALLLTASIDK
jgi:WD40 repeat protein